MKIIVLAVLVAWSTQTCTPGCLACSSTGTCTVCDVSKMLYMNNSGCANSTLTNCAVLSQAGSCVSCMAGFYVDPSTAKCLSVPTANTVTNCAAYSGSIACIGCNSGYYISGAACVVVNTTVANCLTYSGNGVCIACNSGYLFSYNNSLCVTLPTAANCMQFTYAGCNTCSPGFFLNKNLYYLAYSSANVASVPNWVLPLTWTGVPVPQLVCQAVTVQNCVNYTSFNTCVQCASGYYLASGACVINPNPYIPNCATYSTLTTCLTCIPGFYVNNNVCIAITAIPGCITYNVGILSTTTCVTCNSTTYVSGSPTVCTTRQTINVPNCATYSANADTCGTCNSGYMLTSDGKNCYAVVPNCLNYQTWTTGQTSFTCIVCVNTYALSTASPPTCVAGTISNCLTYSNPTTCGTCANGYYLANNICTAHVVIAQCLTYSQSAPNTCSVCNTGFFNFAFDQTCIPVVTPVANCATYNGETCTACSVGYYLANNVCTAIPAASNCAVMTGSQSCSACNAGFFINTNVSPNTCISSFDYISTNCDSFVSGNNIAYAAGTNICANCKVSTLPYAPCPPSPSASTAMTTTHSSATRTGW